MECGLLCVIDSIYRSTFMHSIETKTKKKANQLTTSMPVKVFRYSNNITVMICVVETFRIIDAHKKIILKSS